MESQELRRVDVPEVFEVFVDELRFMTFDGHQLRMEFDVMRKDGAAPQDDSRRCVYTASRIVMSAHGVPGLLDQMTRLQAALTPAPPAPGQPFGSAFPAS
ncbi:hypothetical protein [Phenylobacterium sp.]|jgi:hypothetical protein|uniref:hypothetical protein n=1 Tax=Phenylobacterium sp. TaxID=1871053 RepID=UPI002E3521A5|nr:hypothetical protein [Phenylobacterium sp.]HEX4712838.1 hypothetical protein [Phenylobacterium sp.]